MAFPTSPHPQAPLSPGPRVEGSGSLSVVPGLAALACPRNWLEVQTLASPHPTVEKLCN